MKNPHTVLEKNGILERKNSEILTSPEPYMQPFYQPKQGIKLNPGKQ